MIEFFISCNYVVHVFRPIKNKTVFFADLIFVNVKTMTQNKGMHFKSRLLVANYKPFVTNLIQTPCLNNLQNNTFHPESYFNLNRARSSIVIRVYGNNDDMSKGVVILALLFSTY